MCVIVVVLDLVDVRVGIAEDLGGADRVLEVWHGSGRERSALRGVVVREGCCRLCRG